MPFQPSLFGWGKELIQVKHLFGIPLKGWLLVLPANIRLARNACQGQTLDYYENVQITNVKGLITLALDANVINIFLRNLQIRQIT
jgi:hypothetical protein